MAIAPGPSFSVTSTEKANQARLRLTLGVNNVGADHDRVRLSIAVTTLLKSALSASYRLVGVKIELDKGTGSLETVTGAELGANVQMTGTLDGYGARTLSFSRRKADDDLSPFLSSILRAQKRVKLTGYLGVPGAVQGRLMFDGYTRASSFSTYPAEAAIQTQDFSVLHATKQLFYNLEPGSLATRRDVFLEICADYDLEVGSTDFGPNDGGVIYKGITAGGDIGVLDFLREFLTPIGRRFRFTPNGAIHVYQATVTGKPVVRRITAADIAPGSLQIGSPATTDPNRVSMSSTVFSYIGSSGERTDAEIKETTALYAPKVATNKQTAATGVISALSLTSTEANRIVSKVITTTTRRGGTIVRQQVETWGYYAPRAANKRSGGGTAYNNQFDVYQYADGSWRTTPQEDFQVVSRVWRDRLFYDESGGQAAPEGWADGQLYAEVETVQRWAALPTYYASLDTGTGAETLIDVLVTDDGEAWGYNGQETLLTEKNSTIYWSNAEGQVSSARTTVTKPEGTFYKVANPGGAYPAPTIYVFGPTTQKTYARDLQAFFQVRTVIERTFSPRDESKHIVVTQVADQGLLPASFQSFVGGGQEVAGSIPYLEIVTSKQSAQPATETVEDEVRMALTQSIDAYFQNDFCETPGELRTAALEELRRIAHIPVSWEMPIDWTIEEGAVVELAIPEINGTTPVKLFVNSVGWSFDGLTGTNTQRVDAQYFQPELDA